MKVQITMTKKQAEVLAKELERVSRIHAGQFGELFSMPVFSKIKDSHTEDLLHMKLKSFTDLNGIGHSFGVGLNENQPEVSEKINETYEIYRQLWTALGRGGVYKTKYINFTKNPDLEIKFIK